jgi:hypothetical protein
MKILATQQGLVVRITTMGFRSNYANQNSLLGYFRTL